MDTLIFFNKVMYHGHLEMVREMLFDPTLKSDNLRISFNRICDNPEIIKLLSKDSRFNIAGETNNNNIRQACLGGKINIVKFLLSHHSVDPTASNSRCLINAAGNGHLKVVKLLLEDKRVAVGTERNSPIRLAFRNGHVETAQFLIAEVSKRRELVRNIPILPEIGNIILDIYDLG